MKYFKLIIIVLALVLFFSQKTEAKVKKSHKAKAKTSKTIATQNIKDDNDKPKKIFMHEFVDLGLPSGTLWATKNIGASKSEDLGDYYSWGETKTKKKYNWDSYKYGSYTFVYKYCTNGVMGNKPDGKKELDPIDDAANINWGDEWCIPSLSQYKELRTECSWEWTSINGVRGYLVKSKRNNNSVFFPAAGNREEDNTYQSNAVGSYWSRTLNEDYPSQAYDFAFSIDNIGYSTSRRFYGKSIRAVRKTKTTQIETVKQKEMSQESNKADIELDEIKSWIQGTWSYTEYTCVGSVRSRTTIVINVDNILVKRDGEILYSGPYYIIDNNSKIRYYYNKKYSYYSDLFVNKEEKMLMIKHDNFLWQMKKTY